MNRKSIAILSSSAAMAFLFAEPAFAQAEIEQGAPAPIAAPVPAEAPAPLETTAAEEAPVMNEDEMADFLNSQQQLQQDVTLTRSVDGAVVETTKKTVVYSKEDPLRNTEAGMTPLARLKAEFDSQALTRKEAIEEAKLDFTVADLDRDDQMSIDEFGFLVKGWEDAAISGVGRGRFVDPYFHVDEAAAKVEHAEQARAKFAEMAGADLALSRRAFVRNVSADFGKFDVDDNGVLQGEELLNFRAGVRGENIILETPPTTALEQ